MTEEETVKRAVVWLLGAFVLLCIGVYVATKLGWIDRPTVGKIPPPSAALSGD
jgi:hypothetical protein